MEKGSRIFLAGHRGLVGSALLRRLERDGYSDLLTRTKEELDLTDPLATERFFSGEPPEYVLLAAAKVGGIVANDTYPADFIRVNLQIQTNVIDACQRHGVRKLLFLGSSCIYPKHARQPMSEDQLLTGPLEPTNAAYALAKLAGIQMVQAYRKQHGLNGICLMPTNLYGPGDNFDLVSSHVVPALMRKFHEAKEAGAPEVVVWGTGNVRREFLHVDDLADACLFLMRRYDDGEIVNVGCGEDFTIRETAEAIAETVDYRGRIVFDTSKPDGTPRKLLDVTRLTGLGWRPRIDFREGLAATFAWYVANAATRTR